ncbi:MAG TPA: SCO family protein [Ferruginibacter sp.]|nr:SCO family protein [Ferruginibacter sp.]
MNSKGFITLLLVLLIPLTGYFIVKFYSKYAVHMPRHYFYDDVKQIQRRGKTVNDTIWHPVKNISFTNQMGKAVSLDDAKGKVLVVNFFFTRCPSICPGLTRNMKKLQDSFEKNPEIVQFISISVDPEHDSVQHLRKFADRFDVNHDTWWFVTGNKKEIYDFAIKEIKANIADVNVDTAFVHTENFFLLDSNRVVRGWYNGFDTAKLAQLAGDIPTLMLERDRKSPSIFREFIPILPLIFIGIGMVLIITLMLNRNRIKA